MRTQVAVAVKRHCRSWSACALVSLGAIAAVCSLLISVEPVGILAQTPALAATPSAAAGWFHPFTPSSSESSDDAGAPAGACGTPIRVPKVALCFLVRHAAHHDAIWRAWLGSAEGLLPTSAVHAACCAAPNRKSRRALRQEGGASADEQDAVNVSDDQHLFSLYVHDKPRSPGYRPEDVYFGHRIYERVKTEWGQPSLTVATQLLLRAALEEPANQHFVLLDETAVPVYPAPATYLLLIGETRSRMRACEHQVSGVRWDDSMATEGLDARHWRKSSQWSSMPRRHAELVAADELVIGRMALRCLNASGTCVTDEHHAPTVLAVHGLGGEATCVSNIVHVLWKPSDTRSPFRYQPQDVTRKTLDRIRACGINCYPKLTIGAAEREGNFVPASAVSEYSCPSEGDAFVQPFERDWPEAVSRNVNCSVFSRKWSVAASLPLFALLQDMGVLPLDAEA